MTQIIPFAPKAVATKITGGLAASLLANLPSGGFPVVSIKGKVFHVVRGDDRTLVTKPGEDDPASSLEVVIVNANPHRSRVYYATGYEEGSNAKPDCYSNNGKTPEADSTKPQSKSCATCVHAQFGSKLSDTGQKGFACANSQRLAIAPVGQLNDPMLLRVPGASLKAFTEFVKEVARAGYDLDEIVTKVGFDYSVAHPALTFKATGVLPVEMLNEARAQQKTEIVGQIIGTIAMPHDEEQFESPVAALPKREPKPEPKAEQEADDLDAVVEKAAAKPKAKVKVEEEAEEEAEEAPVKAAKPAKKPEPAVATVDDLGDDLDSLLDGTDFDD